MFKLHMIWNQQAVAAVECEPKWCLWWWTDNKRNDVGAKYNGGETGKDQGFFQMPQYKPTGVMSEWTAQAISPAS